MSSVIWVLQDCWDEVLRCQLMLCVITIENKRTVFEQSPLASVSFLSSVLVSARDKYEQYLLLSKKNGCRMYGKNFFSVYVSHLD